MAPDRVGHDDIYDWIAARLEPCVVRHALDAGCGVGYGALRLARRFGCAVTGVTLSRRELASARAAAEDQGLLARVQFRLGSFDELPVDAYDLVVAVESLKHSANLEVSLRSLLASLKPGGHIVIVEDLYDGRSLGRAERALCSDWQLDRLYAERDFLAVLEAAGRCRVFDLTDSVRYSARWRNALRFASLELLHPFVSARTATALRAFRGGLRLEALYRKRAMAYKALFCAKASD